jgi:hypothetical protein
LTQCLTQFVDFFVVDSGLEIGNTKVQIASWFIDFISREKTWTIRERLDWVAGFLDDVLGVADGFVATVASLIDLIFLVDQNEEVVRSTSRQVSTFQVKELDLDLLEVTEDLKFSGDYLIK